MKKIKEQSAKIFILLSLPFSLICTARAASLSISGNSISITENVQYDTVLVDGGRLIISGANLGTTGLEIKGSHEAPGVVTVINGGTLAGGLILVGGSDEPDNTGIVQLKGTGTNLISAIGLNIGAYEPGEGVVDISEGAHANTAVSPIGDLMAIAGGTGIVSVSGAGSEWTANKISLGFGGENGKAVLNVSNSATVKANLISVSDKNYGWLIIGSANQPTQPGEIIVPKIELNSANSFLVLNHLSTNYNANWSTTGIGSLYSLSGTTQLNMPNTYSGYTVVRSGLLRAGSANVFSPDSVYYVTSSGALDLNGIDQSTGTLHNTGTVYFDKQATRAGTTLTVIGDYHGSGGTLTFNGILAGDNSITDRLHITGNADGGTNVSVKNMGGQGAETVEGIKLISVGGNIASGTEFRQINRIVAGAYDYRLVRGGNGGDAKSWYLTSTAQPINPPDPVNPINPIDPETPAPPPPPPAPEVNINRPEAGSYMTNQAATHEMFTLRLEDRGEDRSYIDPTSGEKKVTSMWLRADARDVHNRDQDEQLKTQEDRYVVQLGGDVARGSFFQRDEWHLGLMAGYGNSDSSSHSLQTHYESSGNVDGYSIGIYGTWFDDGQSKTGAYIDTWLQYAWFDNTVQGQGLPKENYDSDGYQASVESGYTFPLGGADSNLYIQPQAQLVWDNIDTSKLRETNGTVISPPNEENLNSRLGAKLFVKIRPQNADILWAPYISANWLHNTQNYGVRMDHTTQYMGGAKNTSEMKIGVNGMLTEQLSIWGSISGRAGDDHYSETSGAFGISYNF
ncbi:autotransporter outer membrane beta-barrel domain-containing protein [Pseudomonas sp. QL9]|uniref:autotransporter outer membrane beta-barrel domain-containing protein n=1 Tax=Pseudomonas sp. QL9 TaxID=3242725 RepID=UPI00352BB558